MKEGALRAREKQINQVLTEKQRCQNLLPLHQWMHPGEGSYVCVSERFEECLTSPGPSSRFRVYLVTLSLPPRKGSQVLLSFGDELEDDGPEFKLKKTSLSRRVSKATNRYRDRINEGKTAKEDLGSEVTVVGIGL